MKIPNTTSFRANTVQQGVGEILTKNVCPTLWLYFHSSIVSTKLNQVHFEWAQEKPDSFINVIKLEEACNNLI